jgi:hypothetical protein
VRLTEIQWHRNVQNVTATSKIEAPRPLGKGLQLLLGISMLFEEHSQTASGMYGKKLKSSTWERIS